MQADPTARGPKPWAQHRLRTIFLRVPLADWPAVKRGVKREFRAGTGPNDKSQLWQVKTPTPVVAYSLNKRGDHDAQLMVLEATWMEPLGAITPESLAAEGFKSLAEFRRYWMARERKRFQPTRRTFVYRVRPWRGRFDEERFAALLLGRLYGDFIPDWEPLEEAA
jgi:hypothetical protein